MVSRLSAAPVSRQRTRNVRRASVVSCGLALLAAGVAVFTPCRASAQGKSPFQAPPPNVLLLVDTSGSMERMPDGSLPVCTPGVAGGSPNRWASVMQGLTGSVQPFFSCGTIHRDGTAPGPNDMSRAAFLDAYWKTSLHGALAPGAIYDDGYGLPHHRPLSGSTADSDVCGVFANGKLSGLPGFSTRTFRRDNLATYPWTAGSYTFPNGHAREFDKTSTPSGSECEFLQSDDGQIDVAARFARFGLMTFDNDPSFGTGQLMNAAPSITLGSLGPASYTGGGWTFIYSNSDGPNLTNGVSWTGETENMFPLAGRIPRCADLLPMAVGARNQHAPSWEGPFIGFPGATITQSELVAHNADVQAAIVAARPYGGTPTAGLMASAYDYLIRSTASNAPKNDPYVTGGCREQYAILLSDGAPNLDLRTQELCSQGLGHGRQDESTELAGDTRCPFFRPARTAERMRTEGNVTTFVVGFAVGHDGTPSGVANEGFPSGYSNPKRCADWRASHATQAAFNSDCENQKKLIAGDPPDAAGLAKWETTTARACCELNDIALAGSNNARGAYFAETQTDLVSVFAEILGSIASQSATRSIPAYSTPTTIGTGATAVTQSSMFVSSFVADAGGASNGTASANIWRGQIERRRSTCASGTLTPDAAISQGAGDDYLHNLQENLDRQRYFFTALPSNIGGHVDGNESIRPYASGVDDGVLQIGGYETMLTKAAVADDTTFRTALGGLSTGEVKEMFDVDKKTCKETRLPSGVKLNKLTNETTCARVLWGFTTAASPTDLPDTSDGVTGAYAVRCPVGSAKGQSTDPKVCQPLGAIIHSTPAIASAPSALLRDEGYRKFAEYFKDRRQTLYVETIDGLLHAFDVNYPGRGGSSTTSELWAFAPPSVFADYQANFPGGQQVLTDSSPIVKDVVFERAAGGVSADTAWHTVLVAGAGKDGYFALDVSADGQITNPGDYSAVTNGNKASLASALRPGAGKPVGPHFLWQLTSTEEAGGGEKGKKRKGKKQKNKRGKDNYALFGDRVGTPAITTLYINDPANPTGDGQPREVGVAILPGGIDDDVPSPAPAPSCNRRSTEAPFSAAPPFGGAEAVMNPRSTVRRWAADCDDAVSGRSVTIVRLDTGEVIRHFARANAGDDDVPKRLLDRGVCPANGTGSGACRVINSPFDAPMTGTPVVFPNDPGSVAQKVFIGDADGTVYRLDLSNSNPTKWTADLFLDTRGPGVGPFTGDKPIVVTPVVSLSEKGSLVVNVANGDQEELGSANVNDHHVVWSVTEVAGTTRSIPQLNWYLQMDSGERVTGPMAVFDKALYFATYRPNSTASVCAPGESRLYGVDFVKPELGDVTKGGAYRMPAMPNPVQFVVDSDPTVAEKLLPGVTVRASQACASDQATYDYFAGGARNTPTMTKDVSYSLVANVSSPDTGPGKNSVKQIKKDLALPVTQTVVDAWASVVE